MYTHTHTHTHTPYPPVCNYKETLGLFALELFLCEVSCFSQRASSRQLDVSAHLTIVRIPSLCKPLIIMFIGRILCDNYVDLLHYGRSYCSGTPVELCSART